MLLRLTLLVAIVISTIGPALAGPKEVRRRSSISPEKAFRLGECSARCRFEKRYETAFLIGGKCYCADPIAEARYRPKAMPRSGAAESSEGSFEYFAPIDFSE